MAPGGGRSRTQRTDVGSRHGLAAGVPVPDPAPRSPALDVEGVDLERQRAPEAPATSAIPAEGQVEKLVSVRCPERVDPHRPPIAPGASPRPKRAAVSLRARRATSSGGGVGGAEPERGLHHALDVSVDPPRGRLSGGGERQASDGNG